MKMLILCMTCFFSIYAKADIAIIVSKSSSITNADAKELERLYLGKSKTLSGVSAVPINQGGSSSASDEFNRIVLNKSTSQVKAYWSKLVFTGKGNPPKEVGTDAEVISAVKGDASTVGYIDAGSAAADVKVLATLK